MESSRENRPWSVGAPYGEGARRRQPLGDGVPTLRAVRSRRALLAAGILFVLLAGAAPSRAEESPTVVLGPAGPDRRLPLGKAFFLQGSSQGAERVNAVFVRTSFGPFGIGRAPKCEDVLSAAGPLRRGAFVDGVVAPGPASGDILWTSDAAQDHPVLVASGWSRPSPPADGGTFVVRVPEEPSFFRPGADYCLFVYATERPAFDGAPLLAAAEELREGLSRCTEDACESAALGAFGQKAAVFREATEKREWETCPGASEKVEPCPTALGRELRSIEQDLTTAALLGAQSKRRSILRAAAAWPAIYRQSPLAAGEGAGEAQGSSGKVTGAHSLAPKASGDTVSAPPAFVPAGSPLGRLLLGLLSRYHEVRSTPTGTGLRFFTGDGAVEIAYLRVGEALRSFEVVDGLTPKSRRAVLSPDTSKVLLPDSEASLLDLLELARGRVWTGARHERMEEALSTGDGARLAEIKGRLGVLRDALRRADRAQKPGATVGGSTALSGADVYRALGLFWRDLLTTDCAGWARAAGAVESDHCKKGRDGISEIGLLESPLEVLVARLGNYAEAESAMSKARARVSALRGGARVRASATVSARASFSVSAGVTQHVTPSVGIALATRPDQAIAIPYGGIKVYPWPNPVDEPMWSNGSIDLRRAFALEIGLGVQPKELGQDGRFSGPGGGTIPPVLIGAAFQLLPYSTISAGVVLLEARRSTLSLETPRLYPSFYVGASIDANVFDAIAAVFASGRKSSTGLLVK